MALAEVGPERRGDPDLAVGDLPEKEVGDPHLPARADQEIRIGKPGRAEPGAEGLLVDLLGREPPRDDVVGERAARVHDLRAPAVVQGDVERHAAARGGRGQSLGQLLLDRRVELVHPPDDAEPDVVLEQVRELAVQVLLQERHERDDLEPRPLPVLDREGIERQSVELETSAGLHGLPHRGDPGAVAFHAGRPALPRPAAVAVHDDRHVAGQPRQVDLLQQLPLCAAGRRQDVLLDHGISVKGKGSILS